jgi:acyl-CoA thioesterase
MNESTAAKRALAVMLEHDHFTRWLGIIIDVHKEGYCSLHFSVRKDMLNGFGIVHGGVLFSAADSAFAFACNSYGVLSVALDASITFVKAAVEGDLIYVEAKELHNGRKTGLYDIVLTNQEHALVAAFRGTAYRTEKTIGA